MGYIEEEVTIQACPVTLVLRGSGPKSLRSYQNSKRSMLARIQEHLFVCRCLFY
jgi:hypothetical protein